MPTKSRSASHPPLDPEQVLGVSRARMPRHIAIIMDGNGRWANSRNLHRIRGHQAGSEAVREIVTECARLGIKCLTLYSFSMENWKRPAEEVNALMDLYARYLVQERKTIMDNNVRFVQVGRKQGLPKHVVDELRATTHVSKDNSGLVLALALNYGSRTEIVDAIRRITKRVLAGKLRLEDIDEALVSNSLYTQGLPDPDLLIRTANERRISNFLLWQISYAEIHLTETLWPDFRKGHLHEAIQDYARRERRYGDAVDSVQGD